MHEEPTKFIETSINNVDVFRDDNIDEMYLTFIMLNEEYGICLKNVIEIVVGQKILKVPDVPDYIKGVINLRGKVIPIMDVRMRFDLPFKEYDDRLCIVIAEIEDNITGLVVDMVKEVLNIPNSEISSPPRYGDSTDDGVIQGIAKRNEDICIILNIKRLLSKENLSIDFEEKIIKESLE
jgi:purine-binding chemotaxis protein CheW